MSENTAKQVLFYTFIFAIGIITWTEMKKYHQVPRPSRYVGASLTWGLLALGAPILTYPFVSVFSLGLLLMLITSYFEPGSKILTSFFGDNKVSGQFILHKGD